MWGIEFVPYKEQIWRTKGLISADRSNKATLLLTIPRSLFKSSAKDLSSPIFEITIQELTKQHFHYLANVLLLGYRSTTSVLYLYSSKYGEGKHRRFLARILT